MEKALLDTVMEKTRQLINAPTCSIEAKTAAQNWLDAIGTEKEVAETQKYIAELEEDIMPIDNLIAFASSPQGIEYFGADSAKNIVSHSQEIKAVGAKYCDCPACAAAEAILNHKELMLK